MCLFLAFLKRLLIGLFYVYFIAGLSNRSKFIAHVDDWKLIIPHLQALTRLPLYLLVLHRSSPCKTIKLNVILQVQEWWVIKQEIHVILGEENVLLILACTSVLDPNEWAHGELWHLICILYTGRSSWGRLSNRNYGYCCTLWPRFYPDFS